MDYLIVGKPKEIRRTIIKQRLLENYLKAKENDNHTKE